MFGLGAQEVLLILVLVLIFFGAEKIPHLAKSLGKGLAEFRRAQQEIKDELLREADPTAQSPATVPAGPAVIVCPSCGGWTAADSAFCCRCGQRMTADQSCRVCQRTWQPDEKFCPNCGQHRFIDATE